MFLITDFELHNGAKLINAKPLTVQGAAGKWSYIMSFANKLQMSEAAQFGAAEISLNIEVISGKLEVGALQADWQTFVAQTVVVAGKEATLRVNHLADVVGVVVRNADQDTPAQFVVQSIDVEKCEPFVIRPNRGFGSKSAIEDIAALARTPINVIFDVGANVGDTAHAFSERFPEASIFSFEPHPSVCQQAAARFAHNEKVIFRNAAIGASKGQMELNSYSNSAINSLHAVAADAAMDGEVALVDRLSVPVVTLDDVISEQNLSTIDILKLDTQGFELNVLKGAKRSLSEKRFEFIIAELLFVPLYDGQADHSEVTRFLEAAGYRLFDYYDFVYADDGQIKWGDGLFRRQTE